MSNFASNGAENHGNGNGQVHGGDGDLLQNLHTLLPLADYEDQQFILEKYILPARANEWLQNENVLRFLATFRLDPRLWATIRIRAKQTGMSNPQELERVIDSYIDLDPDLARDSRPAVTPLNVQTALELLREKLPPQRFVIPGLLSEGLGILAGRPKKGKSWLALNLALSVSCGGIALGQYQVEQGDVLYLDLWVDPVSQIEKCRNVGSIKTRRERFFSYLVNWVKP